MFELNRFSSSSWNTKNFKLSFYLSKHFFDLSRHPNSCITIVSGPHQGECTTAGRYQFLTSTWLKKVQQYHPKHSKENGISYSFEPQLQDRVVYAWLRDRNAWRSDIADLLKQGKLEQVLRLLSSTWTSLGYGTENNSITPLLSSGLSKSISWGIGSSSFILHVGKATAPTLKERSLAWNKE